MARADLVSMPSSGRECYSPALGQNAAPGVDQWPGPYGALRRCEASLLGQLINPSGAYDDQTQAGDITQAGASPTPAY